MFLNVMTPGSQQLHHRGPLQENALQEKVIHTKYFSPAVILNEGCCWTKEHTINCFLTFYVSDLCIFFFILITMYRDYLLTKNQFLNNCKLLKCSYFLMFANCQSYGKIDFIKLTLRSIQLFCTSLITSTITLSNIKICIQSK